MLDARLPRGSREYLLDRADTLHQTTGTLANVFARWGARRVVPTTFVPLSDVERPELAIVFRERETGRLLALRSDLTPQIRRIVEQELKHLKPPFKLYYIERVWVDETHGARPKERLQAGVEWIGPPPRADGELLRLALDTAAALSSPRPTLVLGHAALRAAWDAALVCRDRAAAAAALDSKSLSAWQGCGDARFPDLPLLTIAGGAGDDRQRLQRQLPEPVWALVQQLLDLAGASADRCDIVVDPTARPPAGYYTGAFFALHTGTALDPWVRGGRYGFDRPQGGGDALGFAVDLDALVEAHAANGRPQTDAQ